MNTPEITDNPYFAYQQNEINALSHCTLCPRNCGVNRFVGSTGFCKTDALFRISSVCVHKGEEPVISGEKGICNVFFPHCNLQCIFCQNTDISNNEYVIQPEPIAFEMLINKICAVLNTTENIVGFVSPSHCIPQMLAIIRGIKETGRNPIVVYNSNGYDKPETLKLLEGIIDVYLPDFKYMDSEMAFRYSQAHDYPEVASAAIKEMFRQKGAALFLNNRGLAESGIIVRHLVLPGATKQSIDVLRFIADEISPKLHISLMSQYFPTESVKHHNDLNRFVTGVEYKKVMAAYKRFGFHKGWVQSLKSHAIYKPNFSKEQAFEN